MKILALIPRSTKTKNIHRDVLYGCWCKGNRVGGGNLPPLSLLSVATILKEDGNEVYLIDMIEQKLNLKGIEHLVTIADLTVVLTSSMSFQEDALFLNELKYLTNGKITNIIFGSHPTFLPHECLSHPGIDFIIKKEPEFIIRDLARAIREGADKPQLLKVLGIGYKTKTGVFINNDYPCVNDCNLLPIPDRGLLPKKARYFNPAVRQYPYTTALTSRGCPGKCTFCTAPQMFGNTLRFWSPEKTLDEIKYLLSLGYKEIYYRDETFTTFKMRNQKIFSEIIKRRYKFKWICNVRADTVDKEDLVLMKKAGCRLIKVGVETGSQEILNRVNKHITLEQVRDVFRWSNEIKLDTHAHLMFGMPGENRQTLDKTLKFIKELRPTTIDVGICTPYPGTKIFEDLVKSHKAFSPIYHAVDLSNLHIKAKYNEVFTEIDNTTIESYITKAYREFYINFFYWLQWLKKIHSISDIANIARAGLNVISFAVNKEKEL